MKRRVSWIFVCGLLLAVLLTAGGCGPSQQQDGQGGTSGLAQATAAAFADAGVEEKDVRDLRAELDAADTQPVYNVEFVANDMDYDYRIDGSTGEVLWSQKAAVVAPSGENPPANSTGTEQPTDQGANASGTQTAQSGQSAQTTQPAQSAQGATTDIGGARAKEIALAQAGVQEADAWELKTERDYARGKLVYEVDFETAENDYDYQIDGATGEILWSQVEPRRTAQQAQQTQQAQQSGGQSQTVADIGGARAKEIALSNAGVREADTRELKTERDYERGKLIYEVEFEVGQYDYDYQIDAATGEILWNEVDL